MAEEKSSGTSISPLSSATSNTPNSSPYLSQDICNGGTTSSTSYLTPALPNKYRERDNVSPEKKKVSCTKSKKVKTLSFMSSSNGGAAVDGDEKEMLTSPLQRKHFKPSSVLELVEGLQPKSTSTSVDQYSLYARANRKVDPMCEENELLGDIFFLNK